MSQLKPGAKYVYENSDGVIYAREFGEKERFEIGRTLTRQQMDNKREQQALWDDIIGEAKNNPALQTAIDRVIMLYQLSKDYERKN